MIFKSQLYKYTTNFEYSHLYDINYEHFHKRTKKIISGSPAI